MALLSRLSHYPRRRHVARRFTFESLERRNMLAVLVDVGHHFVEPDLSGQTVSISVGSTAAIDAAVAGFDLRAEIVTAKQGPYFQGVRFAGDLWNSFPHVESGGPFPTDPTLASGHVAFAQGFEAQADGMLVKLTIDTTGIPAGSYEFRLVGTRLGNSSFHGADGLRISETITNGTLQVRSIWQNADNPTDINGDGRISPVDVLLLLNELSKKGSYELPMPSTGEEPASHLDVNGDGYLSPLDPLETINCLNGLTCATTPKPILARVTPNLPGPSDATSVGKPVPDDSKGAGIPSDGTYPGDCGYYEPEEDEVPVPVSCDDVNEPDPDALPVDSNVSNEEAVKDAPLADESETGSEEGVPSTPVTTVLSPQSVDEAIFDLGNKLFDEETSDELVELGLFAIAS